MYTISALVPSRLQKYQNECSPVNALRNCQMSRMLIEMRSKYYHLFLFINIFLFRILLNVNIFIWQMFYFNICPFDTTDTLQNIRPLTELSFSYQGYLSLIYGTDYLSDFSHIYRPYGSLPMKHLARVGLYSANDKHVLDISYSLAGPHYSCSRAHME